MSKHKITWYRSGSTNGMDWEDEQTITFEFRAGAAPIIYPADNADPGWPDEIELVSVEPGSRDDLVHRALEDEAETWLSSDGYDAAIEIAYSDLEDAQEYARERAADLRADR